MSTLVQLAGTAWPDATADELLVIAGASTGTDVDFTVPTDVRPALIRWLCTNPAAKALIDPLGLRLTNVHITGDLDLRNISIDFLIRLHECEIDGEVRLNDARVRSFGLNGSSCHRLLAWRAHFSGGLFLSESIDTPFRARDAWLSDVVVSGNIHLEKAELGPATENGPALVLDRAQVTGLVLLHRAHLQGRFEAFDAKVGGVFAGAARFESANAGRAIELVRCTVTGQVNLSSGTGITTAAGAIAMPATVVGGTVDLTGVQIRPASKPAADPGAAEADDSQADDDHDDTNDADDSAEAEHGPRALPELLGFRLTHIGGHLLLVRTIVIDGSVTIWDADIGQDLVLDQSHQAGADPSDELVSVKVVGTRIGKRLVWSALVPDAADVDLSGSTADLLIPGATERWPSAGRVWFDGLHYRVISVPTRYRRQWAAGLSRRLRRRSTQTALTELLLRLGDIAAGADATALTWLRRHTRRNFDAQPYDTLAAALRARGKDAEAVRVLIARGDDRRRSRGLLPRLLGLPYRLLVGNGFRTWWAGLWIILLTLVGTAVFTTAHHNGELTPTKAAGQSLPFQPFIYSLDALLPIVNLGQSDAYLPTAASAADVRTFLYLQICLGWLLATALAASAASALQRRNSF